MSTFNTDKQFEIDLPDDTVTVYYDLDMHEPESGYYGGPIVRGVTNSDGSVFELDGNSLEFFIEKATAHYVDNILYYEEDGE